MVSFQAPIDSQKSFFSMALAIMTICQKELFALVGMKQGEYFMAKWSLSDNAVCRYRDAGKVLAHLQAKNYDKLPENEGQCRALAKVIGENLQAKTWEGCLERLAKHGEAITAKSILKMARRIARTGSTDPSKEEKEAEKNKAETTAFVEEAVRNATSKPEAFDGYTLTLMSSDQKTLDAFREVLPEAKKSNNSLLVRSITIGETLKKVADLIDTLNPKICLTVNR